jgi:DNA-binding MarR family transcriptional regulator
MSARMHDPARKTVHGLGPKQRRLLSVLLQYGTWHDSCGWTYGTPSETERILLALERRGLVQHNAHDNSFRLTTAGKAVLNSDIVRTDR